MSQPLKRLTPSLWVSPSEFFDLKSGVFTNSGDAYIIDPGISPQEVEALVSFVDKRAPGSQTIILTHSHWDHLMGVAHFPGCKLIAQANFPGLVQGEAGEEISSQVARLSAKYKFVRPQAFKIPQPAETFDEKLTLPLGDLELHLIHAPGHSADQLVVYLPEESALWAGDMLSDLEIPYVNHSLAAYRGTLEMLAGLEVACLVPGHGNPTQDEGEIRRRFAADRAYLIELDAQVGEALAGGLSLEETLAACRNMHHPGLEENIGAHRLNVESVYLELGGDADPAKVGWGQVFE